MRLACLAQNESIVSAPDDQDAEVTF